jgi:hypothetical protein
LKADEALLERRRQNVSNFGATWLKPPGVAKSLFQMREERREQEEHAEALRREHLAQELADAEAAGAAAAAAGELGADADDGIGVMVAPAGDPMDEDAGGAVERDLDDDIPDADGGGFGFDGSSEDEDDDEDEDEDNDGRRRDSHQGGQRQQQRELANRMATMRATEDRVRELLVRGQDGARANTIYGAEEEDLDNEDEGQLLEEDDLVRLSRHHHGHQQHYDVEPGLDMDMDADLDDDIPEAESGGYEHTDTEADLSSSDEESGHHHHTSSRGPPSTSRARSSLLPSSGARNSIDISSILSQDGSSAMGSSPQMRRRN